MQFLLNYLFQPLFVREIKKNSVILGDGKELFGFKLISRREFGETIDTESLENLRKFCYSQSKIMKSYDQFLYVVFYRTNIKRNVEHPLSDLEVFIFTEQASIAKEILARLPVKLLSGVELTNTLLRVQTLSEEFTTLQGSKIVREMEIFRDLNPKGLSEKFEALLYSNTARIYKKVLREKLTKEKIDYYVAVQPSETEIVDLAGVLSLDWEGALWIILNLNDLSFVLRERLSYIPDESDRVYFHQKIKEYEKGEFPILGLWIYLATKQRDIPVDVLFGKLSVQPLAISYNLGEYVYKTPLRRRDLDYMLLKTTDYVAKLIPTDFRKFYKHEEPKFYGSDRFGLYVSIDMFDPIYKNAHMGVIGPAGSGKSTSLLKITSMALEIDFKKLYEKAYSPEEAKAKMYIRYFDKGFSGELFFRALKENGFKVEFGALKESEMLFNPLDIEIKSADDLVSAKSFFVSLINSILEVKRIEPLEGLEETALLKLFDLFISSPEKYASIAKQLKVKLIPQNYPQLMPIYRKIVENIGKSNIGEKTLYEIGKEYGIESLTKPTILDMIKELSQLASNPIYTEEQRKILNSLRLKLQGVVESPFGWFSYVNLKTSELLYLDIDTIINSPYFTPYVMTLLKILVDKDKYEKPKDVKAFYIFDEVHTLFDIKAFRHYLQKLTLELRKFKIGILFASQNPEHFPKDVLDNLNFHMVLSPLSVWNSYKTNLSPLEAEELYTKLVSKISGIKGSGFIRVGVEEAFSINIPFGKWEAIFLNTDPGATITLKDGTKIKRELIRYAT
jgi:ABC-type dipeptide/oligopeptide/nickel transport system ATPase component